MKGQYHYQKERYFSSSFLSVLHIWLTVQWHNDHWWVDIYKKFTCIITPGKISLCSRFWKSPKNLHVNDECILNSIKVFSFSLKQSPNLDLKALHIYLLILKNRWQKSVRRFFISTFRSGTLLSATENMSPLLYLHSKCFAIINFIFIWKNSFFKEELYLHLTSFFCCTKIFL